MKMEKKNIDWDKFMNNPFIKVYIKWTQFLEYAREHNKKVIILNRRDRL